MAVDLRGFRCPHCNKVGTVRPGVIEGKGWCANVVIDIPIEQVATPGEQKVSRRDAVMGLLGPPAIALSIMNDGRQLLSSILPKPQDINLFPAPAKLTISGRGGVVFGVGRIQGTGTVTGVGTDASQEDLKV